MQWSDEGILLHLKAHGENGAVVTLLTQNNGLRKGYTRPSKKYPLQPGSVYSISSKSRTSQLSFLNLEADELFSTYICLALSSPYKLSAINAMRSLLYLSIIELDTPSPHFYALVKDIIKIICTEGTLYQYALFELELLTHCGFGLDLTHCAVTHSTNNLAYVSPKTGRAVAESVGAPYANKLFHLPAPFKNQDLQWTITSILDSLTISGFFLEKMMTEHLKKPLPPERSFLISQLKTLQQKT